MHFIVMFPATSWPWNKEREQERSTRDETEWESTWCYCSSSEFLIPSLSPCPREREWRFSFLLLRRTSTQSILLSRLDGRHAVLLSDKLWKGIEKRLQGVQVSPHLFDPQRAESCRRFNASRRVIWIRTCLVVVFVLFGISAQHEDKRSLRTSDRATNGFVFFLFYMLRSTLFIRERSTFICNGPKRLCWVILSHSSHGVLRVDPLTTVFHLLLLPFGSDGFSRLKCFLCSQKRSQ